MIPILIFSTHKGGEGKTTFTINFAEYFSKVKKLRTLAIDFDEQANLSGRFLKMVSDTTYKEGKAPPIHPDFNSEEHESWDGRSSIADIFFGQDIIPYPTAIEKLDIIPSHSGKINEIETIKRDEVQRKIYSMLRNFLYSPEVQSSYDVIVIDTPPSKGNLTRAAMKVATHLMIPARMEKFSMEGIYGMLQLWKAESYERDQSNPFELIGIVANQLRNIIIHRQFYESLNSSPVASKFTIPIKIHERSVYAEVIANENNPKSIFDLPASNQARQEFEGLCEYVFFKMFKTQHHQVETA
ncbi:MAG: ParA family protein [Gammaproteobacteria bacterium]